MSWEHWINQSKNQPFTSNMATSRDREILNAIVNPLLPIGEAIFDDEQNLPQNLKDEKETETEAYK